jgi:hypothetical protein
MIKTIKIGEYHDQPELSDIRRDIIAHVGVSGEVEEIGGMFHFLSDDESVMRKCSLLMVDIGMSTVYNVWSLFTETWEPVDARGIDDGSND